MQSIKLLGVNKSDWKIKEEKKYLELTVNYSLKNNIMAKPF